MRGVHFPDLEFGFGCVTCFSQQGVSRCEQSANVLPGLESPSQAVEYLHEQNMPQWLLVGDDERPMEWTWAQPAS